MWTLEGCAAISTSLGDLEYYASPESLWNKNHVVAINGSGLAGDNSSTQGALFIPHPVNPNAQYLFTHGNFMVQEVGGHYSEIKKISTLLLIASP